MKSKSKRKAILAVERLIRKAFSGVMLEDGIGLMEGLEIDSYSDGDVRAAARETDEKMDWAAIPVEVLNGVATSLTYVDAKGMRFHLPAYLIADLHGELHQDIRYHLNSRALDSRFSLLSSEQKAAVRHYLELQLEVLPEPNFQFEQSAIRESIKAFWAADREADHRQ